ncbi:hypothetical protein, partial [Moorena sp. SIO4G3]|uniref:hypothetical protein n=1 Tax=Moorena sp. SIO4G3 TaxID=2607821 RepID=UPI0025D19F9C
MSNGGARSQRSPWTVFAGFFLSPIYRVSQRDCSRFVPKAPCEQVSKYTAQPIPKELTYLCHSFSLI